MRAFTCYAWGEIEPGGPLSVDAIRGQLAFARPGTPITLLIDSEGGDVGEAEAVAALLTPLDWHAHAGRDCSSAALRLWALARWRTAGPDSAFTLHEARTQDGSPSLWSRRAHLAAAVRIRAYERRKIDRLCELTEAPRDYWRGLIAAETTLTAAKLLKLGLAQFVGTETDAVAWVAAQRASAALPERAPPSEHPAGMIPGDVLPMWEAGRCRST